MVDITVTGVEVPEGSRGVLYVTVKLSDGVHEEVKELKLFRYFLKKTVYGDTLPATGEFPGAERYEALLSASEATSATIKAVDLLAFGDCTVKKLSEKLRSRGFSKESIEGACAFALDKGYIREEEHLARLMETLCEKKKYGIRRIRSEVYAKGFSEEAVKAVFEEVACRLDFDGALVDRLAKVKGGIPVDPLGKKKLYASLLRYGFTPEEISRHLR